MRVMSYNLRTDTPGDGELSWVHRIPAVRWVWEHVDADIVGIQEGKPHQAAGIDSWFPHYQRLGVGRDEDLGGECVAIYFKRDVWRCLEHGNFWLSDTPKVPGSRSFGNTLPRMCTWARLQRTDGERWFVLNTHLDHQSEPARVNGAEMILNFVQERAEGDPIVVTGDFNATPDSEPLRRVLADGRLVDVFAQANVTAGTFHGYTGEPKSRIDYILSEPHVRVEQAVVLRDKPLDLWPSDHFPIYADLSL